LNDLGPNTILAVFVLFCRIGGCLLIMPGFSSPRIPVQVRLFIAIAVTLTLTPIVIAPVQALIAKASPIEQARLLIWELMIGLMIGLLGRLFFLALETIAMAMAMGIGLASVLGAPFEEGDPMPPIVNLITLAATVLLFATDQHWEVFRGLIASYSAMPVADGFGAQFGLIQLTECLSRSFLLAIRIGSPFIIFAIVVNVAIGLTNKLTPQIPVYFISMPFVLVAGLILLYFSGKQLLEVFIASFSNWLASG
jgi:flagellar biosynthetic protein FliR